MKFCPRELIFGLASGIKILVNTLHDEQFYICRCFPFHSYVPSIHFLGFISGKLIKVGINYEGIF